MLCTTPGGGGQEVKVTNDGATILKSIGIDNAAAKILVGMCVLSNKICITVWCSCII